MFFGNTVQTKYIQSVNSLMSDLQWFISMGMSNLIYHQWKMECGGITQSNLANVTDLM